MKMILWSEMQNTSEQISNSPSFNNYFSILFSLLQQQQQQQQNWYLKIEIKKLKQSI